MRYRTLILAGVMAVQGFAAFGCEEASPAQEDIKGNRSPHTSLEFGSGREARMDRGVPEGSSTNPRVENGVARLDD